MALSGLECKYWRRTGHCDGRLSRRSHRGETLSASLRVVLRNAELVSSFGSVCDSQALHLNKQTRARSVAVSFLEAKICAKDAEVKMQSRAARRGG